MSFSVPPTINMGMKKTTEQFIEEAKRVHGDKYDYSLVSYKNNSTRVEIACPHHGIFHVQPNNHLHGIGCRACSNERKAKTTEQFIEDAKRVHGDKYDYSLTKYKNARMKVEIVCPEHGSFLQKPNSHVSGKQGCPLCTSSYPKTPQEVVDDFTAIHGERYSYVRMKYINDSTKVEIVCPEHGSFFQTPNNHKRGNRCPKCTHRRTRGEQKIYDVLKEKGIVFEEQYVLEESPDLRNTFKYDFYLPQHNMLIEFDGQQHHEFVPFIHKNPQRFIQQQDRDNLKDQLASKYKMNLFRITHKDLSNVSEILQRIF